MKTRNRILSLLVLLCLVIGLLPGMALAAEEVASGTCGENVTWVLDSDGVLTISGEGEMDKYYYDAYWGLVIYESPWESYTGQIKTVVIEDGVTTIGDFAFNFCRNLTSVKIGNDVTEISYGAFYECHSLTSVTIPDGVTVIGYEAFYGCTSLTSVTIPDSVTEIVFGAFHNCTSLTTIEVGSNNANYCSQDGVLFNKDMTKLITCPGGKTGEYTIPDCVDTVDASAFFCCTSLTNITIPDNVTSIGREAFWHCTSLTSITIGKEVTLGEDLFYNCSSLTAIEVDPENANYCSQDGVLFNKDMTELITCPAGKTGEYSIPNGVTTIGYSAFCSCEGLVSVTIPDSVITIDGWAFGWCTSLTNITIPDSVTAIGPEAFYRCYSLTSVTIGSGVTSIGGEAFSWCTSLTSVTIPASITTIWEWAFEYCTRLDTIIFEGDAPATIYDYAFYNVIATAYYPAGNETWTEDVMQNYGGTITWVAYTPGETAEPVVTVTAGEGAPATDASVPLTGEDLALGGIGVEVAYDLSVNVLQEVPEDAQTLIEDALDGDTLAMYLDIALTRTVGETTEAVTSTDAVVRITITIPEELRSDSRTFYVIRVHDGEADILPDLDEDPTTVTIQTDRFSTYALAYTEDTTDPETTEPETTEPETTEPETTEPEITEPETIEPDTTNPKTGDSAPLTACIVLMLLAAAAVVTARKRV
ncbi:MAG: leucine-rich repeat domain-containing protein, partial [Firmicutes bacterium]|nr:leucine-rich repeat domain-containing protein [Bacillota bacterium]